MIGFIIHSLDSSELIKLKIEEAENSLRGYESRVKEANAKLEFLEMSGERIARDMKASAIKLRAYFTFLRQSNVADINIERANQ